MGVVLRSDSGGRLADIARRVPLALRIGLLTVWGAAAAFGKWEDVNNHDVPVMIDVALATGGLVFAALGVEHFFRTWDRAHRPPFELSQGWFSFFIITGSLLVLGIAGLVDHDPKTYTGICVGMVAVGVVLVALFVRYLLKPVEQQGSPQHSPYLPPPGHG